MGDQYYNWDGVVALLMLERFAGLRFSVLEAEQVFVVRDWLPPKWNSLNVSVPVTVGGKLSWVDVAIARTPAGGKTASVRNNPLEHINVDVWLEGKQLDKASPPSFNVSETDRVGWSLSQAAKAVVATVSVK